MRHPHRRLMCLFVERHCDAQATSVPGPVEVIELPGVTSLQIRDNLVATADGVRPHALVFAPLADGRTPKLALTVHDPHAVVRVNGQVIGPTRVLQVRDVIEQVGEGLALHVSLFQRPYVGPPREEHVGRECPVCLLPILGSDAGKGTAVAGKPLPTLVTECVVCGVVLHVRAVLPGSPSEILECSPTIAACPCCDTPLVRKEGYVYEPEF